MIFLVVSFSLMRHWSEHDIRVNTFCCVLALMIAHLTRRIARRSITDRTDLRRQLHDLFDLDRWASAS